MRRPHIFLVFILLFSALMFSSAFAEEHDQKRHGDPRHQTNAISQAVVDALDRPAVQTKTAAHSVLLAVTKAGNRLVAVGERGIVIFSDDGGRTWKQGKVPTSVSLTAVKFVTPKIGWAVGHSGAVIHTEDGGETWTRQLDGITLAKLAVDYAQNLVNTSGAKKDAAERLLKDAQLLESDGPDKPFLNLYFENETTGFVVGAYGIIFKTEDAGKTWKPWMDHVENPGGMHLYSIAAQGNNIYIAGEQGLFLRSIDNGNKFVKIQTPYQSTYFNLAVLPTGELFLGGMKGNAYRSTDQGKTFKQIPVPIPVSFSAVTIMSDGNLVFANQGGMLLMSTDKAQTIVPLPPTGLPPVSGVVDAGNGTVMTVGMAGAVPIPLNAATTSHGGQQ